ncbi:MAG: cobU [Verrucomicrobiaceae bacterium]|nr:cobU [Verrucomicrobiaceae bacterium]
MIELILGGARSGKSRFAEQRALDSGSECIYIATAQAGDGEMAARIQLHREQRSGFAQTIEEPLALAQIIADAMHDSRCLLVDCLTLWLTNLLLAENAATFADERAQLFDVLSRARGRIIFVSNEVGQGVVPMDALSRRFVDDSGRLHQAIAQIADRVFFVTAGLPQLLKGAVQ